MLESHNYCMVNLPERLTVAWMHHNSSGGCLIINLKKETKGIIMAAQNQAITTNCIKVNIFHLPYVVFLDVILFQFIILWHLKTTSSFQLVVAWSSNYIAVWSCNS